MTVYFIGFEPYTSPPFYLIVPNLYKNAVPSRTFSVVKFFKNIDEEIKVVIHLSRTITEINYTHW